MELFAPMRREYGHGVGTTKGVARKFGVHRRRVREAIANAVPPARKVAERDRPKLEKVMPWIEQMVEEERKAPRKQRHTAHRIWRRLGAELLGAEISESTVRKYVRARKQELELGHFEGRSWRGFHHHAALCIAAYGFLVAERSRISASARAGTLKLSLPPQPEEYRPRGSEKTGTAR